MRLDASKYPSNSWDSVPFVTGAGDIHEVKLLDHAAAIGAADTPASLRLELTAEVPDEGLDYWHRWFRDTRYTVAHTNRIVETQLAQDVEGGEMWLYVGCAAGFRAGDWVDIERTATSEELVFVLEVDEAQNRLPAYVTIGHLAGS